MFHELPSRDREDERATGQPQGVGSEAYLKSTSQGPTSEDARKGVHIRGLSRLFMKHPGWISFLTGELLSQLIGSLRHEVGAAAVFGPTTDQ